MDSHNCQLYQILKEIQLHVEINFIAINKIKEIQQCCLLRSSFHTVKIKDFVLLMIIEFTTMQ